MATRKTSGFDEDLVRKLAALLDETGLSEIEYGKEDWHVRVAKHGGNSGTVAVAAGAPAPVAIAGASGTTEAPTDSEDLSAHPGAIVAPMVGVVYTAPEPDAPPFVKVGDTVKAGDTLVLIEAMKVFNPIDAPRAGTVQQILINSGEPVEYGEPLVILE